MKDRLMDYLTGDCIREATAEENRESGEQAKVDGGAGVITVSDQGKRRVYVETAECGERKSGTWTCDVCGQVFDESQGYSEIDGGDGYRCEACSDAAGVELDNAGQ